MTVAKPKLIETTQTPPRRDAGMGADAANPNRAMTLAEAAEMLEFTQPMVNRLVDNEVIPHHMVGTHRRVMHKDVLALKKQIDRGNEALDRMVARDQEMGLYPTKP